jgi:SAM-dependent methyltransferase
VPVSAGPPLPPAKLRIRVAGTGDAVWFLESGRLAVETIQTSLRPAGTQLEELRAVLDFGCGCGRVVRWLDRLPGQVFGSDFDGAAIAWCRRNIPFARFHQNGLAPPLAHPDESVDLVYAFSVLTHLPVPLQHRWMAELVRVVRPGGFVLLSTHGEYYVPRLAPAEQAIFRSGDVVVRYGRAAGTNLCTVFHPREYVRTKLAKGLEVVSAVPEGAKGSPHQDLFLLRKA